MKNCSNSGCKQDNPQPLSNFHRDAGFKKDGRKAQCKGCIATRDKIRNAIPEVKQRKATSFAAFMSANPDYTKDYDLKYKYGLTPDQKLQMLEEQNFLCAIPACSSPATDIDHNHTTGEVRGMPCGPCNQGMGCLQDSPQILTSAAHYLNNNFSMPIDRSRKISLIGITDRLYRRKRIRQLYRITLEEELWMLALQDGACAICKTKSPNLHVDHCHETDVIRGLLCGPCNRGIGQFSHNPDKILSGAEYLTYYSTDTDAVVSAKSLVADN